jgi:hypothetical protein
MQRPYCWKAPASGVYEALKMQRPPLTCRYQTCELEARRWLCRRAAWTTPDWHDLRPVSMGAQWGPVEYDKKPYRHMTMSPITILRLQK